MQRTVNRIGPVVSTDPLSLEWTVTDCPINRLEMQKIFIGKNLIATEKSIDLLPLKSTVTDSPIYRLGMQKISIG